MRTNTLFALLQEEGQMFEVSKVDRLVVIKRSRTSNKIKRFIWEWIMNEILRKIKK